MHAVLQQISIDVAVVVESGSRLALLRHCCGWIDDWMILLQRQSHCLLVLRDLEDIDHFRCRYWPSNVDLNCFENG